MSLQALYSTPRRLCVTALALLSLSAAVGWLVGSWMTPHDDWVLGAGEERLIVLPNRASHSEQPEEGEGAQFFMRDDCDGCVDARAWLRNPDLLPSTWNRTFSTNDAFTGSFKRSQHFDYRAYHLRNGSTVSATATFEGPGRLLLHVVDDSQGFDEHAEAARLWKEHKKTLVETGSPIYPEQSHHVTIGPQWLTRATVLVIIGVADRHHKASAEVSINAQHPYPPSHRFSRALNLHAKDSNKGVELPYGTTHLTIRAPEKKKTLRRSSSYTVTLEKTPSMWARVCRSGVQESLLAFDVATVAALLVMYWRQPKVETPTRVRAAMKQQAADTKEKKETAPGENKKEA